MWFVDRHQKFLLMFGLQKKIQFGMQGSERMGRQNKILQNGLVSQHLEVYIQSLLG